MARPHIGRRGHALTKTRYFLHIRNINIFVEDLEGVLAADLLEARAHAVEAAHELQAEGLLDGELIAGRHLEMTNAEGDLVEVLPFSELLRIPRRPAVWRQLPTVLH